MRKLFIGLIFITFLLLSSLTRGANISHDVTIFTSPGCPHCTTAKSFLSDFKKELNSNYDISLEIHEYTFAQHIAQATALYTQYSVPNNQQGLVPVLFIGEKYFVGFNTQIEDEIRQYLLQIENGIIDEEKKILSLPILGEINLLSFSLPVLAITLGIVDGFNVCSLGALLVILGLVMFLRSRKRIFLLGGSFLLTSAIMYALLIFLRHQLFSFIAPYIKSMELLIGILALGGGIYLLREFYLAYKRGPICSSNNLMSRLVPKIEKIFKEKTNWIVLIGAVMLFAILVTVIEFPCSAFLPVLFTSILVDSEISLTMSLLYIGLYMIMYLLDEIIIFTIAVVTLRIKIVSPKFIIFFNLLAAVIFIALGAHYLLAIL